MRKLGWFAVSLAVAMVIAASILLLAVNLYVQSQGAQQRIHQALAGALHIPVSLQKTTVTPWGGLRLDGITLAFPSSGDAVPDPTVPANSFVADSFRVRLAWWPLLIQHRVVVKEVVLDHPILSWAQGTDGRWTWPQSAPAPPLTVTPGKAASAAASAPTPPMAAWPPAPEATPSESAPLASESNDHDAPPDRIPIKKFRLRHGALDFLNAHRKLLGRFREVNVDGELAGLEHASGEAHCEVATFAQTRLRLTNFSSSFWYDEEKGLSIEDGKGKLAGGEVRANYQLFTHEPGSPFAADCRLDDVDLSQLLTEAGSPLHLLEGRLEGNVRLQGSTTDPEQRRAIGQLRLIGAQVRNFAPLQLLGEMLRIRDLTHLQFKKAELDCELDGDHLEINPVELAANDLQVSAKGHYTTDDDRLAIHGRLLIDEAIGRQLPQFIEMNFTPCGNEAPGSRYIEFDVTGPLGRPNTNLFDRVLAGPSNGLLENLLAPRPKKIRAPKVLKTAVPPVPPPSSSPPDTGP